MGEDGRRRRTSSSGGHPLSRLLVARVVPDLATFAVDDGFRYSVPDRLSVEIGSMVRIPLGGRRVRGYVTDLRHEDAAGLKEVTGVSGDLPAFGERLLRTLRWAARHYVAPLPVLLRAAAPPNVPRRVQETLSEPVEVAVPNPLSAVSAAAAEGRRRRAVYLLGAGVGADTVAAVSAPVLRSERSVLIVAATAAEVGALAAHLEASLGVQVLMASGELPSRALTAAWSAAASQPGRVLVGTPRVALWPVAGLALAIVREEGRRAMKERQTPTLHARDVLRVRSAVERFNLVFQGRVPTTELIAAGIEVVRMPGRRRAWPPVEVVDRSEEPPGGGVVTERARRALRTTVAANQRAFVFTHRHGYAPATRCAACRQLRTCVSCGSRPDPGAVCSRCGAALGPCTACGGNRFEALGAGVGRVQEELRRVLGERAVGSPHSRAPVWVGTERDLAALPAVALAVAVDVDGLALGTSYRHAEDALRVLARVAAAVPSGAGKRMLAQTSHPRQPIAEALRTGDPLPFLETELASRESFGFPPFAELIVIEVREGPAGADDLLRRAVGTAGRVLGPAPTSRGLRWLIQGSDLGPAREALRDAVQSLRDGGGTVRVDVDPIDL